MDPCHLSAAPNTQSTTSTCKRMFLGKGARGLYKRTSNTKPQSKYIPGRLLLILYWAEPRAISAPQKLNKHTKKVTRQPLCNCLRLPCKQEPAAGHLCLRQPQQRHDQAPPAQNKDTNLPIECHERSSRHGCATVHSYASPSPLGPTATISRMLTGSSTQAHIPAWLLTPDGTQWGFCTCIC